MGTFDFLTRPHRDAKQAENCSTPTPQKLSYAEKERILVQRTTLKDMTQFTKMPFSLNYPVRKFIEPHAHPFAYIDLAGPNISAAINELNHMNARLKSDCQLSRSLPQGLIIPVNDVVFTPSKEHGYTRLICTPYTFDGEISAFPLSLAFMTDLSELTEQKDTAHGTLFYGPDGTVAKAEIYFWRGQSGYLFYYETLNQSFVLSRVELSRATTSYHPPETIYRDEYWIKLEQAREQEAMDFEWLQSAIPDRCPKSIAGFRRMKHSNTKKFQSLVAEARRLGRNIE